MNYDTVFACILPACVFIYVYIYICVCICICIYIHTSGMQNVMYNPLKHDVKSYKIRNTVKYPLFSLMCIANERNMIPRFCDMGSIAGCYT